MLIAGLFVLANGQDIDEDLSDLNYGDVTIILILFESF